MRDDIRCRHLSQCQICKRRENNRNLSIGGPGINLLAGVSRHHPNCTPCHQILDCPPCQWPVYLKHKHVVIRKPDCIIHKLQTINIWNNWGRYSLSSDPDGPIWKYHRPWVLTVENLTLPSKTTKSPHYHDNKWFIHFQVGLKAVSISAHPNITI